MSLLDKARNRQGRAAGGFTFRGGGGFVPETEGDPEFTEGQTSTRAQFPSAAAEKRIFETKRRAQNVLDELKQLNPEDARIPELEEIANTGKLPEEGGFAKALSLLDAPRRTINLAIQDIVGGEADPGFNDPTFGDYVDTLLGRDEEVKLRTGLDPESGSRTLEEAEIFTAEAEGAERVFQALGAFTFEVLTDPLSYVGLGAMLQGRRALARVGAGTIDEAITRVSKGGAKFANDFDRRVAKMLRQAGDDNTELGAKVQKEINDIFEEEGVEGIKRWMRGAGIDPDNLPNPADLSRHLKETVVRRSLQDEIVEPLIRKDFASLPDDVLDLLPATARGGVQFVLPFLENTVKFKGLTFQFAGTRGAGKKAADRTLRPIFKKFGEMFPGVRKSVMRFYERTDVIERSLIDGVRKDTITGWQYHALMNAIDNAQQSNQVREATAKLQILGKDVIDEAKEKGLDPDIVFREIIQEIESVGGSQFDRVAGEQGMIQAVGQIQRTLRRAAGEAKAQLTPKQRDFKNAFRGVLDQFHQQLADISPEFVQKIDNYVPHLFDKDSLSLIDDILHHGSGGMLEAMIRGGGEKATGAYLLRQILTGRNAGGRIEAKVGATGRMYNRKIGTAPSFELMDQDSVHMLRRSILQLQDDIPGLERLKQLTNSFERGYLSIEEMNGLIAPVLKDIAEAKGYKYTDDMLRIFNEDPVEIGLKYIDSLHNATTMWNWTKTIEDIGLGVRHPFHADAQKTFTNIFSYLDSKGIKEKLAKRGERAQSQAQKAMIAARTKMARKLNIRPEEVDIVVQGIDNTSELAAKGVRNGRILAERELRPQEHARNAVGAIMQRINTDDPEEISELMRFFNEALVGLRDAGASIEDIDRIANAATDAIRAKDITLFAGQVEEFGTQLGTILVSRRPGPIRVPRAATSAEDITDYLQEASQDELTAFVEDVIEDIPQTFDLETQGELVSNLEQGFRAALQRGSREELAQLADAYRRNGGVVEVIDEVPGGSVETLAQAPLASGDWRDTARTIMEGRAVGGRRIGETADMPPRITDFDPAPDARIFTPEDIETLAEGEVLVAVRNPNGHMATAVIRQGADDALETVRIFADPGLADDELHAVFRGIDETDPSVLPRVMRAMDESGPALLNSHAYRGMQNYMDRKVRHLLSTHVRESEGITNATKVERRVDQLIADSVGVSPDLIAFDKHANQLYRLLDDMKRGFRERISGEIQDAPEDFKLMLSEAELNKLGNARKLAEQLGLDPEKFRPVWGPTGPIKDGFVLPEVFALGGPALDNLTIERHTALFIEQMMHNMASIYTPDGIAQLKGYTRDFLKEWRALATIVRPTFHSRNVIGGIWNNMLFGVRTRDYVRVRHNMVKIRNSMAKGNTLDEALKGLSEGDQPVFRAMFESGLLNFAFARSTFRRKALDDLEGKSKVLSRLNPYNEQFFARQGGAIAMESVEDFLRASAFVRHYDHARPWTLGYAKDISLAAHFDYANLSEIESRIKSVVPFFVWARRNIPLQLKAMIERPGLVNRYTHLMNSVEDQFGSPELEGFPHSKHYGAQAAELGITFNEDTPIWARVIFDPDLPIRDLLEIDPLHPLEALDHFSGMLGPHIGLPFKLQEQREFGDVNAPAGLNEVLKGLRGLGMFDVSADGDVQIPYAMRTAIETALPFLQEYTALAQPATVGIPGVGGPLERDPERLADLGITTEDDISVSEALRGAGLRLGRGLGIQTATPADTRSRSFEAQQRINEIVRRLREQQELPPSE